MGKAWRDRKRRGAQESGGRTTVVPKEKFTAPTSGLDKVTFSWGTTRDAARFKDTIDKLAQNVGTCHVYGAVNSEKAMKDMTELVFMGPVCPPRNYYKFRTEQNISDCEPMVQTNDRFTDGQLNIKLVDNVEWKTNLDLFMVAQKKYEKYHDAWIENRARTYNLVLQHCPPDVEVELNNQSTWTVGKDDQNVFTLLRMICNIKHNMRESKQNVMAIVECAVEMNTTTHKSSETTEEYFDIFEDRKNTVNSHDRRAGYHKGMFNKAMIKIMDEKSKTIA